MRLTDQPAVSWCLYCLPATASVRRITQALRMSLTGLSVPEQAGVLGGVSKNTLLPPLPGADKAGHRLPAPQSAAALACRHAGLLQRPGTMTTEAEESSTITEECPEC
ncbi:MULTISPECIES: hypothetical protein [unclassified Salmonella]|nr:hypothetical protein [Salmonella sp. 32020501-2019-00050]EBB6210750.1 hypothetical protein [Salmonella enterica]EBM0757535.1 hypothetical protein [Salmonella enterica subsp. enterica serovar Muenchen]EBZ4665909.1 hypothetical protein [Salmonella enterica subsp. enterica serovar Bovismorbificans]ECH8729946.1 hypothetical protein [Salmonella enterica subsp. enterica]ECH8735072.1 hypothetical protein [Salmonella enterica subsp. enterica serovar Wandsworth]EGI6307216.1 hypothetical protein [Sa